MEGIPVLYRFLRAIDVDCELVDGGRVILYSENIDEVESEFIMSMITLFQARLPSKD